MKNKTNFKNKIIIFSITIFVMFFSISIAYAYWVESIKGTSQTIYHIQINIGYWEFNEKISVPSFDLDEWIKDGNLNQTILPNQIFSYDGKLFITSQNYNPQTNGLPGPGIGIWLYLIANLNWESGWRYRNNSVVIHNDKYYISTAGNNYNTSEPGTESWAWAEIEPISDEHFSFFKGTSFRDYASPDMDYVIYK